jgi:hypothetical protein
MHMMTQGGPRKESDKVPTFEEEQKKSRKEEV